MKIAVTSEGTGLDCRVDKRFGRCSYVLVVDAQDMSFQAMANPYTHEPGGAGSRLAGLVTSSDAGLVLTGSLGPHARQALEASDVPVVLIGDSTTVRQAVEDYLGRPQPARLEQQQIGTRRTSGYDQFGFYSSKERDTSGRHPRRLRQPGGPAPAVGITVDMTCDIACRPLRLRLYPDTVLRQIAQPIRNVDANVADLARDMLDLMRRHNGIGLAAPQVGLLSRLILVDVGQQPLAIINPQFTPMADTTGRMSEGCLSLPDVEVEVDRKHSIEVRGLDPTGAALHFEASGLLARVIQHEVDHLQGVLICDYAPAPVHAPEAATQ